MYKRLKVKLYPTTKQKEMLETHFDAYRFCYNLCLEYKSTLWKDYKKNISGYDMSKELFQIRKETEWLSKCKAECLREAALNVDKAYKKFFKGNGFPKFKIKKGEQSFSGYQSINCTANRLTFFCNKIKFRTSESYTELLNCNKIKQVTFKKDSCGDYWASCLIELPNMEHLPTIDKSVGIDLGIKDLLITSDGNKFENKKYLINSYYKLRTIQRKHAKAKKGGSNREKLRLKAAKLYRKTVRQKEHYYHKITNQLIRENQTIVMETLSVKNMIKNRKLSRNISDASWGLLTSILQYKCEWYGRELIKIDRWFPSSKTCSECGNINNELRLMHREWTCNVCNTDHDRDTNAAINIRNEGIKMTRLPLEDACNSGAYELGSKQLIINN